MTRAGAEAIVARVGVVADTHVGEWTPQLPVAVSEALAGVDVILHAGDLSHRSVLERLERVAPVFAVRGDHDRAAGVPLPEARVVEVAGWRFGLTHGRRARPVEAAGGALSLVARRPVLLGLHRSLYRRFGRVDCVVYGHLHLPEIRWVDGTLFFSPGGVHNPEHAPGLAAGGFVARRYLAFRRSLPVELRRPAVGVIDVRADGLEARIVPLDIGG